jgi:Tfp pilus assembly protein PilN
MANLLPKKERRRFDWEYNLRLLTVVLLLLTATFAFGAVLLLPSYFISESKGESIGRQSELLQKTISLRESDVSMASLLATKQKIDQLVVVQEQIPQTEIIQSIIKNIDENVTVDAFYYTREQDHVGKMRITGRANSRNDLLSFSDRLEKDNLFNHADLPVSSLVRDSDIIFSITLEGDF